MIKRIAGFIQDAKVFYFTTTDNGKPRVRPFGFVMEQDGNLYFGMGKHKQVYRQLLENPDVEVCAINAKMEWIRVKGVAVPENDERLISLAFENAPFLHDIYNEKTGFQFGLVKLTEIEAEIAGMDGSFEKL